jgi:hypothetical protein
MKPGMDNAYLYRGFAKDMSGDVKGGMADVESCLILNPDSGAGYLLRGAFKLDNKDKTGACDDFHKALSLGDTRAADYIKNNCQ